MAAEHRSAGARASTRRGSRERSRLKARGRRLRSARSPDRDHRAAAASTPPPSGVVAGARQFARSVVTGLVARRPHHAASRPCSAIGPTSRPSARSSSCACRARRRLYAQALAPLPGAAAERSRAARAASGGEPVRRLDRPPEQVLLDATHHGSALFGVGVAVLDRDGRPVWSEPAGLLAPGGRSCATSAGSRSCWRAARRSSTPPAAQLAHLRHRRPDPARRCRSPARSPGFLDASSGTLPGWQELVPNDDLLVTNARRRRVPAGDAARLEPRRRTCRR